MRAPVRRQRITALVGSLLIAGLTLGMGGCGGAGTEAGSGGTPAGSGASEGGSGAAAATSGDVVAVGVLYDDERLVALDPATGQVLWEADDVGRGSSLERVLGFGTTAVVVETDGEMWGVDTGTGKLSWTVELEDADYAAAAGAAVVSFDGDVLTAFDAASGDQRWTYDAADADGVHVPTDGSRVLVAGEDDLILLDAASGEEAWRVPDCWPRQLDRYNLMDFGETAAQGPAGTGPRVPLAHVDDTLVVASVEDADLFAVDARTGEQLWSVDDSDMARYGLLAWEQTVVSIGRDGVAGWDRDTGEPAWELELDFQTRDGDDDDIAWIVQHGQVLLVADPGVGLVAVDLADGTQAWQLTMDDLESVSTAGDVVVAVIDGIPTALDPLTGNVRWTGAADGGIGAASDGDTDDTDREGGYDTELVVLRDTAGGVVLDLDSGRALDVRTGEVRWTLE